MHQLSGTFLFRNSLSIAFLALTIFSLGGQIWSGWYQHNDFLKEHGASTISWTQYLTSGHFLQATFENWESEFLQMALFVILTIFLRQQGSSESKEVDEEAMNKDDLKPESDSPRPVKKGGLQLMLYKHSLSIVFMLMFILSFTIHWYGSWKDFNQQQLLEGKSTVPFSEHVWSSKFWFESFQNWQSEFLSIFAIVFLSIYLRQIGSPQSKPVNASHEKTGDG